jgi:cytochrome subunit of sulfide dehydrogenase
MKPVALSALAVSFALPFSLAGSVYAQDGHTGRNLASACFTCHGTDGNSVQGVPPSLAGRPSTEIYQIMKEFQAGKRPATIMHQQARGYSDAQLKLIAAYFAQAKPTAARLPPRP